MSRQTAAARLKAASARAAEQAQRAAELRRAANAAAAALVDASAVSEATAAAALVACWRSRASWKRKASARDAADRTRELAQAADQAAYKAVQVLDELQRMLQADSADEPALAAEFQHSMNCKVSQRGVSVGSTWDVHVAVHCVKPTGKSAGKVEYDVNVMLEQNAAAISAQETSIGARKRELKAAVAFRERLQQQLREAEEAEEMARTAVSDAETRVQQLVGEQAKLVSGEWHEEWQDEQRSKAHGSEAVHDAWLAALGYVRERLEALHERGVVEHAVLGYVRSDVDVWQRVRQHARNSHKRVPSASATASSSVHVRSAPSSSPLRPQHSGAPTLNAVLSAGPLGCAAGVDAKSGTDRARCRVPGALPAV